jgi:hypothetical protein
MDELDEYFTQGALCGKNKLVVGSWETFVVVLSIPPYCLCLILILHVVRLSIYLYISFYDVCVEL